MARYQLTIRMPNGSGWRIRTASAAEMQDLTRELVAIASEKIRIADLQSLWPDGTAGQLHAFGGAVFESVVKSAANALGAGQLDVLRSGQGMLPAVNGLMQQTEWKDSLCSDFGKRLLKILMAVALAYLRSQFPVITTENAQKALDVLDSLLSRRR